MGIPSYFNYIIKNHRGVFKKVSELSKVDNVYLDSNSIIYEALRELQSNPVVIQDKNMTKQRFENMLYQAVCEKIDYYLGILQPTNVVFIAFDGVAPVAKLDQQRSRRYKSYFTKLTENEIKNEFLQEPGHGQQQQSQQPSHSFEWNQAAITPGTQFMTNLDKYVAQYFEKSQQTHASYKKVIVSGSCDVGEGEHKIFKFIRDNAEYHRTSTSLIYGLDADLIMLCLNHLHISKHIYLFRETPDFNTDLDDEYNKDELCLLNIKQLAHAITSEMMPDANIHKTLSNNVPYMKNLIHDYILISFMLGNDFMPHFPALNIRTHGIDILLETYKHIIPVGKYMCDGRKIYWKYFKMFVAELAKNEHANLIREYETIKRNEKRFISLESVEDKLRAFLLLPTRNRQIEHFIDPVENGWEHRYYRSLLNVEANYARKKLISINYLEGLEWTMKYYSTGCVNYQWRYKYDYPPLLTDLIRFIPHFDTDMVSIDYRTVSPMTQLAYVLPGNSLDLLPDDIQNLMQLRYPKNYSKQHQFTWAFCKYFWESHVDMPEINIQELEKMVKESTYKPIQDEEHSHTDADANTNAKISVSLTH